LSDLQKRVERKDGNVGSPAIRLSSTRDPLVGNVSRERIFTTVEKDKHNLMLGSGRDSWMNAHRGPDLPSAPAQPKIETRNG